MAQKLVKLEKGRPRHVVITYRPGKLICYVNGKLIKESGSIQGDLGNWDPRHVLLFGDEYEGGHRYWRGTLRDVRIYDRALSADEVKARHDAGD